MKRIFLIFTVLLSLLLLFSCDTEQSASGTNQKASSPFTVSETEWTNAISLHNIDSLSINYTVSTTSKGSNTVSVYSGNYTYGNGVSSEQVMPFGSEEQAYNAQASVTTVFDIRINPELFSSLAKEFSHLNCFGYTLFKFSPSTNGYEYSATDSFDNKTSYSVFFSKNSLIKKICIRKESDDTFTNLVCELTDYNCSTPAPLPTSQVFRDFNTAKLSLAYAVACEGYEAPFFHADMTVLLNSLSNFLLNFLTLDEICEYTTTQSGSEYCSTIVATAANTYMAIAGTTINYDRIAITTNNDSIITISLSNSSTQETQHYNFRFIY